MINDQLAGKYTRLRNELAQAYDQPLSSPTRSGLIDRLAAELMDLERRLAALQQSEQDRIRAELEDESASLHNPSHAARESQQSPRLAA